ncbi:MAG: c-type cytochrome domain-containing protein, partial [Planctomycetaceae bacterium]
MNIKTIALSSIILLAAITAHPPAAAEKPEPVRFNRDVRPILSENCFQCHGPDATHREAELRLDEEESATADRGGYAAVVPSKPDESALVERITAEDEFTRMPPAESGKVLSPREIDLLRRWIAEGAEYQPHWSYVPPTRPPVPQAE